jgi:hypothetical protein
MAVEGGLDGEQGVQWWPLQRTKVWLTMSSAWFEPWMKSDEQSSKFSFKANIATNSSKLTGAHGGGFAAAGRRLQTGGANLNIPMLKVTVEFQGQWYAAFNLGSFEVLSSVTVNSWLLLFIVR